MKWKPLLYGFFTGGLAAGISVLLLAPESGKATRVQIKVSKQKARSQFRELKKNLVQLKNSAAYASHEGRVQISKFLAEMKTTLSQWEAEILPHQRELQKELLDLKVSLQELEGEVSEYTEKT